MMKNVNFTLNLDLAVKRLFSVLLSMFMLAGIANAQLNGVMVSCSPSQFIPNTPTPVAITVTWLAPTGDYADNITLNIAGGGTMTVASAPARNAAFSSGSPIVSNSGSSSVTVGIASSCAGAQTGVYVSPITINAVITASATNQTITAVLQSDNFSNTNPLASCAGNTVSNAFVMTPQVCTLSVPPSVTVNAAFGTTSANVTLPLATFSGPCAGKTTVFSEQFTSFAAGNLTPPSTGLNANWTLATYSANPFNLNGANTTISPAVGLYKIVTAAGGGGQAADPSFAGNRLKFDEDGTNFMNPNGMAMATLANIAIPAASTGIKLSYSYRNGNVTGDFFADISTDNGVTWVNIQSQTAAGSGIFTYDVPGSPTSLRVRFRYYDAATWAWSAEVDNILVTVDGPPVITNSFNAGGANASGLYPLGTTAVVFSVNPSATTFVTVLDAENPGLNIPGDAGLTVTGPTGTIASTSGTGTTIDPYIFPITLPAGGCSANITYTTPTYSDNVPNPPAAATFASVVPAQTAANLALLTPTFGNLNTAIYPAVAPNSPTPLGIMGGANFNTFPTGAAGDGVLFGFRSSVAQPLGVKAVTNLLFTTPAGVSADPPNTILVYTRTDSDNPIAFATSTAGWSGPFTSNLIQGGRIVTGLAITNAGSGYSVPPTVTFTGGNPAVPATAVATINLVTGKVTGITILNPGAGYQSAPTITLSAPGAGGGCSIGTALVQATATATINAITDQRAATYALPTTQFVASLGAMSFAIAVDPAATPLRIPLYQGGATALNSVNAAGTLLNGLAMGDVLNGGTPFTPRLIKCGLVFAQGNLQNLTPDKPQTGFTAAQGTQSISWKSTDIAGNMTTKAFNIVVAPSAATSTTLACNDNVNITMDLNCNAVVNAEKILKGGPFACLGNYPTEVYNGTNLIGTTTYDAAKNCYGFNGTALSNFVGKTLTVKVYDALNPLNYCWGNVTLEDKLAPVITCPGDIVLDDCSLDIKTISSVKTNVPFTSTNVVTAFGTAALNVPVPVTGLPTTSVVEGIKVRAKFSTTDWISEVAISLITPTGAIIPLKTNATPRTCNNATGSPYDFTFDAAAINGPLTGATACADITAWNNGSVKPSGSFAAALGLPVNGTWQVRFQDAAAPVTNNVLANGVTIEFLTTIPVQPASAVDGCAGAIVPVETVQQVDFPCGNPLLRTIKRTFKATDAFGNTATCVQNVNFKRPTLATTTFPADVNLDCTYDNFKTDPSNAAAIALVPAVLAVPATNTTWFDAAGNPSTNVTGRPTPSGSACGGIVVDYQDMRLNNVCAPGVGYTIMRTWKVYDACANQLVTKAQQITVKDITAPVIAPIGQVVASTDAQSCKATVRFAKPAITDNCASASQLTYFTEIFNNVTGSLTIPTVNAASVSVGLPTNNPNEYSDLELSPVVFVGGLPRPVPYVVRTTATDACGNKSSVLSFLVVMDITAPVAICPPTMKVSLTDDGSAIITAKEIDRGSYDNCTTIAKMEVRRMAPIGNCTGKDVNKDGDYDDNLVGAGGYDMVKTFYNFEDAAPFADLYNDKEGPEFAMVTNFAGLVKNDVFNNGILERIITKDLGVWVGPYPFQPSATALPTLFITGNNTVIFNSVEYTFVFNGANELLSVTPTKVFLPQFSLTQPFTVRDVVFKTNYIIDPDPTDVYGDYNINGLADDEEYYEHEYYNYYHPEVKFCCEDAGDTIMVAMRIWDSSIYKHVTNSANPNHSYYKVGYPRSARVRGNVNICMVRVIVEDKLAPKIVTQDTMVRCGDNTKASAWLDTHKPVLGSYNATMSDDNLFSNNTAVTLPAGGDAEIKIPVTGLKSVKDLNVALKFYHTELGNLTATITSPDGKSAILFATPVDEKQSNPYTSNALSASSILRLKFDDEPTLSAVNALPFQAVPGVPNAITPSNLNLVNGSYLAQDNLSIFDGINPNGTWTITFTSSDPASAGAGAVVAGGAQIWVKANQVQMPQGYFYDNCDVCVTYVDGGSIDNCGNGTVTRTWTVTDQGGRTATTVQTYKATNRSAYKVEFPDNVTIQCNNNKVYGTDPAQSGKPIITPYANTCPLIGVEFTDDTLIVNGLDNSCFKILRKWKVLNWCQPLNLDKDAVQRWELAQCSPLALTPRTFINIDYAAWPGMSTSQVNTELGECAGAVYDEDGYMEYLQVIKVVDNTPPSWKTVGTPVLETVGKECKVKLTIPASEAEDCTGKLTYTYDIVKASNNVVVATGGASGTKEFTEAEFGDYIVRFRATDNCGNVVTSDKAITVKDIKKPTPVCFNGLSIDLMPTTGTVMINCSALDAGSYDNCGPIECFVQTGYGATTAPSTPAASDVDATATGMTTVATPNKLAKNVQFECLGLQVVRLWIKDGAGNWDYCETYVDVQNNMGAPNVPNCPPVTPTGSKIAAAVATEKGAKVENVMIKLTGAAGIQKYTSATGVAEFVGLGDKGTYTVAPELDKNPLNGVSTLDLVLMSKHILGVQPLNSNYQLIAADVNKSGTVTTADIVELRKMILAIQTNFSKNTSWRFVDKSYQFPTTNPLAVAFPETKQFNGLSTSENAEFVAMKIGDVNGNASTTGNAVGRGAVGTFNFNLDEKSFNAGEEVRATFKADELKSILGYQFTLGYDKSSLELINIEGNTENFGVVEAGAITTSWNGNGEGLFTVVFKAKKAGNLSEMLNINSRFTTAEAYTKDAENLNVAIKYNNSVSKMELYQNQPNPFVGRTVIGFNLTKSESATLTIYDATGRVLKSIEKDFVKGYNEVSIDDLHTSGVLKYTLSTATETATKSMIILE